MYLDIMQEYKNPVVINWYVDEDTGDKISILRQNQPLKTLNLQGILPEIPDEFNKVQIDGLIEIFNGIPQDGEFKVNYSTGIIMFNSAQNDMTFNVSSFYARGIIFYPASRIWTKLEGGQVVETLQELIDAGQTAIENLQQVEIITQECIDATNDAIDATNQFNDDEAIRVSNENTRINNENTRIANETTRGTNETARQTNETNRINTEITRNTNETTRGTNETTRQTNETNRVNEEITRNDNEIIRGTNETTRQTNETNRVNEENDRQTNETTRETNETTRINNETDRQNTINELKVWEEYDNNKIYKPLNGVSYLGSSYICIQETVAGILPTNNTYWLLTAQKGQDGDGAGDMLKSIYDTNNNGIVDNSEKVNNIRFSVQNTEPTIKNNNDIWIDTSV